MVTAYFAYDPRDSYAGKVYLRRDLAQAQVETWSAYKVGQAHVNEAQIKSLRNQDVRVTGHQVFYQFNAESMGTRTFKRTVYDIFAADTNTVRGMIKFKGYKFVVEKKLDKYFLPWTIVE